MRKADPAFHPLTFEGRVRRAFMKLQQAWCGQNLTEVRPFISDGIHERFSLQFEEQTALGVRNQMEDIEVLDCSMSQVECGPVFDVMTMRIWARAKDFMVTIATGERVPGTEEPAKFVEYWSFIRTRGSQTTLKDGGLIEGKCPNCGAAIAMNQGAKCEYCQALLRSGQYDWVLAEITQEDEWVPRSTPPPGTRKFQERDPGFNLQDLEDVTSVIFWRKATADREGQIAPMKKVAAPEWCAEYAKTLANEGEEKRRYMGDCAVSAVDTVGDHSRGKRRIARW